MREGYLPCGVLDPTVREGFSIQTEPQAIPLPTAAHSETCSYVFRRLRTGLRGLLIKPEGEKLRVAAKSNIFSDVLLSDSRRWRTNAVAHRSATARNSQRRNQYSENVSPGRFWTSYRDLVNRRNLILRHLILTTYKMAMSGLCTGISAA